MASKRMSLVESMKRDEDQLDPATVDNFLKHGTATPKPEEKEEPAQKQILGTAGEIARTSTVFIARATSPLVSFAVYF